MNPTLFFILFAFLGIAYLYIGYITSQKITSLEDYFLAGRSFGIFPLTIALLATHIGGGAILGTSAESYRYGFYGISYMGGIAIGLLILALGLAERMRGLSISTTAEVFEKYYHSRFLRKYASLLSIISLAGILTAQIIGSQQLLISLGITHQVVFIIFWAIIIIYTMLGGLKAVVANDIFQLSFIMLIFTALFLHEIISNPHDVLTVIEHAQSLQNTYTVEWQRLATIIMIPALYCLIEQDIAQTIFSAKTKRIAFQGSILAAIGLCLFTLIPLFFGIKAHMLNVTLPANANPLMFYLDLCYPTLVVTLVAYGILAAVISTGDALLCAISSHVVQDFIAPGNRYAIRISQITMLTVGISCMFFASYFNNVVDVIVGSYALPVCALFVPLLIAYCGLTCTRYAAYVSVITGTALFFIVKVTQVSWYLPAEITIIMISAFAYISTLLFTHYSSSKHIK